MIAKITFNALITSPSVVKHPLHGKTQHQKSDNKLIHFHKSASSINFNLLLAYNSIRVGGAHCDDDKS